MTPWPEAKSSRSAGCVQAQREGMHGSARARARRLSFEKGDSASRRREHRDALHADSSSSLFRIMATATASPYGDCWSGSCAWQAFYSKQESTIRGPILPSCHTARPRSAPDTTNLRAAAKTCMGWRHAILRVRPAPESVLLYYCMHAYIAYTTHQELAPGWRELRALEH